MRRRLRVMLPLCLAAAALLRAEAPPTAPGLELLGDNGRSFLTQAQRLPLRCYDAPGLLGLPADEQGHVLDRAAAAGFNSVTFEAPLFGPTGLASTLGKVAPEAAAQWTRLLEACALRQLYAFPVLYTPATVDALIGTGAARASFFGGKNALGWQAWALREAAKISVKGRPLNGTPAVGGWLLYRGPWPDGAPITGRPAPTTPTTEAYLRVWAGRQVQLARRLGFRQKLGLGLWARNDVGGAPLANAPNEVSFGEAAPFASLSPVTLTVDASPERSQALDVLPPVPGADAVRVGGAFAEDSSAVPVAPANPWDLEGLDWDAVDAMLTGLPLASQLDFMELTLDTEDWYRVGDRLAEAAAKAEVPVLWRQDWRTASRYERNKRLAPPAPLAGLSGGWPEEDWPGDGETLWPVRNAPSPETAPFRFRSMKLEKESNKVVLVVELSRPAQLKAWFGNAFPLQASVATKGREKAEQRLVLAGIAPGSAFLIKVQAESVRLGSCVVRTRWARAPK